MVNLNNIKWEIIYTDTFDREAPPSVEIEGIGFEISLYCLWQSTLFEGITDKGIKSFSNFHVIYPDHIELLKETYNMNMQNSIMIKVTGKNPELWLLRVYVYGRQEKIDNNQSYVDDGELILKLIASYHYNLLTTDSKKEKSIESTSGKILELVRKSKSSEELIKALKSLASFNY
jgi:hypothetical protein